jgi:hypothetical protein
MMPIINGVGQSSVTEIKQEHFRKILSVHMLITSHVIRNWREKNWNVSPYFHYFDINAGAGFDQNGVKGSPQIFCEEREKRKIYCKSLFIEESADNAESLKALLPGENVECGDHSDVLPGSFTDEKVRRFGLLYADPNGIFDLDVIRKFCECYCYNKTDILINCNSTAIKRVRMSSRHEETRSLWDRLQEIDKKYWIIREPYGRHQWSFILGTNWPSFPKFEKIGFYKLESKEGREIFNKINLTKPENEQLTYKNYSEYLKHPKFLEVKKKRGNEQMDFANIVAPHTQGTHII